LGREFWEQGPTGSTNVTRQKGNTFPQLTKKNHGLWLESRYSHGKREGVGRCQDAYTHGKNRWLTEHGERGKSSLEIGGLWGGKKPGGSTGGGGEKRGRSWFQQGNPQLKKIRGDTRLNTAKKVEEYGLSGTSWGGRNRKPGAKKRVWEAGQGHHW